ncbi:MAG: fluoride efflux transporter CrcB [Gammaproteobacteria bacterium]|nr:fluoride efflux transporter CrcB [Gammaproteobacteria bacterium]
MTDFLWVSIGAVAGANLRFAVSTWAAHALSPSLPYGTLIVNTTGSLILGFFLIWTSERVLADPHWRLLIAVGFCGAYTTFSSYSFESLKLLEGGNYAAAAGNFIANNLLALLAVVCGAMLARVTVPHAG